MELGPLTDKSVGAPGQLTLDQIGSFDRDLGLLSGVPGVQVGRVVITEVHGDDDAVELADSRHRRRMGERPDSLARSCPKSRPQLCIF